MATSDPGRRESGGTWASREAPGEWQRSAAARPQFFGSATERMLDLAKRMGPRAVAGYRTFCVQASPWTSAGERRPTRTSKGLTVRPLNLLFLGNPGRCSSVVADVSDMRLMLRARGPPAMRHC